MYEKYIKCWLMGIQTSMEYRLNFFLSFLSCIFPLLIQYFLWKAVFAGSGQERVYGYTFVQIFLYSVITGIVSKITGHTFQYGVHTEIKNGAFSKYLVLPVYFFFMKLSIMAGQKLVHFILGMLMITGVLITFHLGADFSVDFYRILAFTGSFILGIILNFILFYGVCGLTFRLNDATYFFEVIRIVLLVVSGGILPLDIFGERILSLLKLLPFQYTAYFPVNILTGKLSYEEIFTGLLIQLLWVGVLGLLVNIFWDRSTKKYITFGG